MNSNLSEIRHSCPAIGISQQEGMYIRVEIVQAPINFNRCGHRRMCKATQVETNHHCNHISTETKTKECTTRIIYKQAWSAYRSAVAQGIQMQPPTVPKCPGTDQHLEYRISTHLCPTCQAEARRQDRATGGYSRRGGATFLDRVHFDDSDDDDDAAAAAS